MNEDFKKQTITALRIEIDNDKAFKSLISRSFDNLRDQVISEKKGNFSGKYKIVFEEIEEE